MRTLLLLAILSASLTCFAQSYSYRFEGALAESAQQALTDKINTLEFFNNVKIRYKSDIQKGELLFTIPPKSQATEEELPYSVITIKQFLIEFGLSPDQFIETTKKS